MKEDIIIDETYKGLKKTNGFYTLYSDVGTEGNITIKIPITIYGTLWCNGDINIQQSFASYGHLIKSRKSLICKDYITTSSQIIVDDNIKCYKDLTTYNPVSANNIEIKGDFTAYHNIMANKNLTVNNILNAYEGVNIGNTFEMFHSKTNNYCNTNIGGCHIIFTDKHIVIGNKIYTYDEWLNEIFPDDLRPIYANIKNDTIYNNFIKMVQNEYKTKITFPNVKVR